MLNELLPRQFNIDGIIYLRAAPDKCLDRLKSRNRTEESSIDLQYLETLHEYHEHWLNGLKNVLIIENDTRKQTSQDFVPLIEKIREFMQQCTEKQ
jgi:deoxyadenosine/deoxycytidine kinase